MIVLFVISLGLLGTWMLCTLIESMGPALAYAQNGGEPSTYYVAPGGACGQAAPCYATVQQAVDAAQGDGAVVKVAAGTYSSLSIRPRQDLSTTGTVTQVVYISKTLVVCGGYTVTDWEHSDPVENVTVLDAQGQGRAVYVTGNTSPTIEGFQITGGNAVNQGGGVVNQDAGGGIYVVTASATISNNVVWGNEAFIGGGIYLENSASEVVANLVHGNTVTRTAGGIYAAHSTATVVGNRILSNHSDYVVGGIFVWGGSGIVQGNTITGNTGYRGAGLGLYRDNGTWVNGNVILNNNASGKGGGIILDESTGAMLSNNVVISNQAVISGSGVYIVNSNPALTHNTIVGNSGGDGVGVYVTDHGPVYSVVTLTNNILLGHAVGIYVTPLNRATLDSTLWGAGGWANGLNWYNEGMLNHSNDRYGDPAFVDPEGGDYHITAASAALNNGIETALQSDMDGEPRPLDGKPDIGADEYAYRMFALSQEAYPDPVYAGCPLTYTLRLTNTGNISLDVSIADALPAQILAVTLPDGAQIVPGGQITWAIVLTAPGGVWQASFSVTVTQDYSGTLDNQVIATTAEGLQEMDTLVVHARQPVRVYLPLVMKSVE